MSYVPIIVPVATEQPPSPRTRELTSLLTKVVDEYRSAHPSVTGPEIREALKLTQVTAGGSKAPVAVALALGMGLIAAALAFGIVFFRQGGEVSLRGSMPMVVLGITVFLGIVVAVIKVASK
jgi:hypothetical protein